MGHTGFDDPRREGGDINSIERAGQLANVMPAPSRSPAARIGELIRTRTGSTTSSTTAPSSRSPRTS